MGRPAAEVPTPHSPMQWQRDMAFATISVSGTSPATATWSRCSCSWPSLALQLKHYQKLSGSKWTAPTCQKEEKKSAFQLTEDDARLKRVAMRLGEDGQGTVRERDWTTQAPGYSQATSSRAYVLGAVVGVLSPAAARRYGQEGKQAMVTTGWVEKAELPLARPRPLGRTP